MVTPVDEAVMLDCFVNVSRYAERFGGSIQYGWLIWEWPTIMIEAEFHAVWVTPQGALKDITPNPFGMGQVLFLPAPDIK